MVDNRLQESVQTGFYEKSDFSANGNPPYLSVVDMTSFRIVYEAIPIPDCVAAEGLRQILIRNVWQIAST